ncbi:hypothetical protein U9M48_010430 [Paspalum notatum var. saurae]|uniref:Reverse transcriptase domain-containing protein n=1 Tax=Paspalum notatum var. saurae TaxID=547442 RepID=A0AAQ3WGH7_PASNO
MCGVMILHEVLHETKIKKDVGVILKLDFEKAYDKAEGFWASVVFLDKTDCQRGDSCVKLNDKIGPYIQSHKAVKQGDPLSPILFNFVADSLAKMVQRAQENNLVRGLISHMIPMGVCMLQYTDDTIICLENDREKARNLKMLLYMYEMMSGLSINFNKSEIILVNGDPALEQEYAELFSCQVGTFPIKYLGVPVSPSRLHRADWLSLKEKINKRLDAWKSGTLSMAGRITLINACLTSTPIYHMSMYLFHKTVIERIDRCRRKFLWQGGSGKKKYHLIKWNEVCKDKAQGGLGIKNLENLNISLLCKWWWKFENEEGLWQNIVRKKYKVNNDISMVKHKMGDFPIWSDLIKIIDLYKRGRVVKTMNGDKTKFWHDCWLREKPLKDLYPVLYAICEEKSIIVKTARERQLNFGFSRWLYPELSMQWEEIHSLVSSYSFKSDNDMVFWKWGKTKQFSVKTMYRSLDDRGVGKNHKHIWKGKIPPKIKIFLILLEKGVILTRDNMVRRKWKGDPICSFCDELETINHLFFDCPVTKVVWALIANCLGASVIPRNMQQCWDWAKSWHQIQIIGGSSKATERRKQAKQEHSAVTSSLITIRGGGGDGLVDGLDHGGDLVLADGPERLEPALREELEVAELAHLDVSAQMRSWPPRLNRSLDRSLARSASCWSWVLSTSLASSAVDTTTVGDAVPSHTVMMGP